MSDKTPIMGTIDDNGEHHARTYFLPIQGERRERQLAIHRHQGVFLVATRWRGSREFEPVMEADRDTLRALRRLLAQEGETAWVADAEGEFGMEVDFDDQGTATITRGGERVPVDFEPPEVDGLIALIDWVESTFEPPI